MTLGVCTTNRSQELQKNQGIRIFSKNPKGSIIGFAITMAQFSDGLQRLKRLRCADVSLTQAGWDLLDRCLPHSASVCVRETFAHHRGPSMSTISTRTFLSEQGRGLRRPPCGRTIPAAHATIRFTSCSERPSQRRRRTVHQKSCCALSELVNSATLRS